MIYIYQQFLLIFGEKMEKQYTIIKIDTEENWNKTINFIPKDKELIYYIFENENIGLKIGNGETKINDLPFVDENEYYIKEIN